MKILIIGAVVFFLITDGTVPFTWSDPPEFVENLREQVVELCESANICD